MFSDNSIFEGIIHTQILDKVKNVYSVYTCDSLV